MDNKTVLITGASRGIGRAFAVLCAKNKDFEFINNNHESAMEKYSEFANGISKVMDLR